MSLECSQCRRLHSLSVLVFDHLHRKRKKLLLCLHPANAVSWRLLPGWREQMAILLEILGKRRLRQGEVHKLIILAKADRDLSCKEDKKIVLAIPSLLPSRRHVCFPTEGSHVSEGCGFSRRSGWDSHFPIRSPAGRECRTWLWLGWCSQDVLRPHRLVLSHGLQLGGPTCTQPTATTLPGAGQPPTPLSEQERSQEAQRLLCTPPALF